MKIKGESKFNLSTIIFLITATFLLTEATRKYYFDNVAILSLLDIALVICFFSFLNIEKKEKIVTIFSLLAIHGLIFSIAYQTSPLTFIAGLRELFPCLVGLFLATSERIEFDYPKTLAFLLITMMLLTLLGGCQIFLGPEHPINAIPRDLGAGRGLGSYDPSIASALSIEIFRPSAVFLTTGKFGTVTAGLSILAITTWIKMKNRGALINAAVVSIIFIANLVAMQRAFFYPLVLIAVVYFSALFIHHLKSPSHSSVQAFASAAILMLYGFWLADTSLYTVVLERLIEFPSEILQRIADLGYLESLLIHRPFLGSGFGFFSNYSPLLGGGSYMEFYSGEGGWHIIAANFGFVGLIVFFCVVCSHILHFTNQLIVRRTFGASNTFYIFIVLVIFLWGYTHNIYAQSFLMLTSFLAMGLLYREFPRELENS